MKTLFSLLFLLAAFSFSGSALAVGYGEVCGGSTGMTCDPGLACDTASSKSTCVYVLPDSELQGLGDILRVIDRITDVVFATMIAVSIIFILISAFRFVFYSDKPEEIKKAQNSLLYAAIGIGVALLAAGFVPVLRSILF